VASLGLKKRYDVSYASSCRWPRARYLLYYSTLNDSLHQRFHSSEESDDLLTTVLSRNGIEISEDQLRRRPPSGGSLRRARPRSRRPRTNAHSDEGSSDLDLTTRLLEKTQRSARPLYLLEMGHWTAADCREGKSPSPSASSAGNSWCESITRSPDCH